MDTLCRKRNGPDRLMQQTVSFCSVLERPELTSHDKRLPSDVRVYKQVKVILYEIQF
jgi:hypothetical protein